MSVTIKEFAEKYRISYCQAYELSYGVEPVPTLIRDKDFPEDELFENLVALLHRHQFDAEKTVAKVKKKISEVNKIRAGTLHPNAP